MYKGMERKLDKERVDFGLIVALTGELKAILNQLPGYEQFTYEQSFSRTYYRGRVYVATGGSYDVVVSILRHMGNVESALATNDLIRLWSPRYVFVVGIAGGLNRSEQNFGDIVIGESIWYYEPAKVAEAQVIPGPRVIPADLVLLDRARNFRDISWLLRVPNISTRSIPGKLPQIHFSPIASGEKVIAAKPFISELRKLHRKMAAVEMEGAGAASAALSSEKRTGFMAIRGISDFADMQKNDNWQEYAADTSAAWTFGFLASGPIPPVDRSTTYFPSPVLTPPPSVVDEVALFKAIQKRINMDEFKTLCFILGVDVDEIPGETKSAKVRELILWFKRRSRLSELETIWRDFRNEDTIESAR